MKNQTDFFIPSFEQVKKLLAAANTETRYLRRLYQIAKEKAETERLRSEVESQKKGGFSHDSNDK